MNVATVMPRMGVEFCIAEVQCYHLAADRFFLELKMPTGWGANARKFG